MSALFPTGLHQHHGTLSARVLLVAATLLVAVIGGCPAEHVSLPEPEESSPTAPPYDKASDTFPEQSPIIPPPADWTAPPDDDPGAAGLVEAHASYAYVEPGKPTWITITGRSVQDDTLAFSIYQRPADGRLGQIEVVDQRTARVRYEPNAGFNGWDFFTFGVRAGDSDSVPAAVTLIVGPPLYFVLSTHEGPAPLTVEARVYAFDGEALPEGQYHWEFDEQERAGPVSTHAQQRFTFRRPGVHRVALTLVLGGLTIPIGCEANEGGGGDAPPPGGTVVVLPTISGTLTDSDGAPLAGIEVVATDVDPTAVSDANGEFVLSVPVGWSGSIYPATTRLSFTPTEYTYVNVDDDQDAADFVAVSARSPHADAGPDLDVTDSDGNGDELVALDASASSDPDGAITWYRWERGTQTLYDGPNATCTVNLSTGIHDLKLTVTDGSGLSDDDDLTVRVNPPATLSVTPADELSASGDAGGPFSPNAQVYELLNLGGTTLDWSVSKTADWISLSPNSGTLAPGQAANLLAFVNAQANALPTGAYTDTLVFINETLDRESTTRGVQLTVNAPAAVGGALQCGGGELQYLATAPTELHTRGMDRWSLRFWCKRTSMTQLVMAFSSQWQGADPLRVLLPANAAVEVEVDWNEGSTSTLAVPAAQVVDAWNHVVATYDGTVLRLYVNDSPPAEVSVPGRTTEITEAREIWFARTQDDVYRTSGAALWTDHALSSSEVTALLRGTVSPLTTSVAADWYTPLDGTSGAAQPGDAGLQDTQGTVHFTQVHGQPVWAADPPEYHPPLAADLSQTYVDSSGELLVVGWADASGNAISTDIAPDAAAHGARVRVNGGAPVTLSRQMCYGPHLCLRLTGSGISVNPGDDVQLYLPAAVINDGFYKSAELPFTSIDNAVGLSPVAVDLSGHGAMQLGINASWYKYWTRNLPHADQLRQCANRWNPVGGTGSTLVVDDATGLPVEIVGGTTATYGALLFADQPYWPTGTWRVRWQSDHPSATAYLAATGTTALTESGTSAGTPGTDGAWQYRDFAVTATDGLQLRVQPGDAARPITALEVLHPGYTDGQRTFRDEYLANYGGMPHRFMLAQNTNTECGVNVSTWSDRTPDDWYTWTGREQVRIVAPVGSYTQANANNNGFFRTATWEDLRGGSPLQVVRITTSTPHGLTSGNIVRFDGSKRKMVYVTGPFTFLIGEDAGYTFSGDITLEVNSGPPLAGLIAMVNELGVAPWLCIPHGANDDYVRNFCDQLLASGGIPTGRTIYLEFGNEIWNDAFPQAAMRVGFADVGDYDDWHAERTAEVHALCRARFSAAGRNDDLVCVLGSQSASPNRTDALLTAYHRFATAQGHAVPWPDAVAIAPYIGRFFYEQMDENSANAEDARDFFLWSPSAPVPLGAGAVNTLILLESRHQQRHDMLRHQMYVETFNTEQNAAVELVCYEGVGPHISFRAGQVDGRSSAAGGSYTLAAGEALEAVFRQAPRHPNFRYVVLDHLCDAEDAGIKLYTVFVEAREAADKSAENMGVQEWYAQVPGPGDGTGGGYDNRQDLSAANLHNLEAVRLQALHDWRAIQP